MFGKKNAEGKRYIVAVKDYDATVKSIKEGKMSLPYDKSIYLKLIESQTSKATNLKDLKKFIKVNGKSAKEVGHYWEGLLTDGYFLINVEYNEKLPSLEHLCNNEHIKFVCIA